MQPSVLSGQDLARIAQAQRDDDRHFRARIWRWLALFILLEIGGAIAAIHYLTAP